MFGFLFLAAKFYHLLKVVLKKGKQSATVLLADNPRIDSYLTFQRIPMKKDFKFQGRIDSSVWTDFRTASSLFHFK